MTDHPTPDPSGTGPGRAASTLRTLARSVRPAIRLAEVRLRVPAVLVIAALVVGRWGVIRNHWDWLTRGRADANPAMGVVSNDTEYFCPMDPGVISNWPSKCGICNMGLVLRRKGDATVLPDGVIARMQLSPYRVQLAGVLTAPVEFRPLACETRAAGQAHRVEGRTLASWELPRDRASWARPGMPVEVRCRDLAGHDPFAGKVLGVEPAAGEGASWGVRVSIAIDDPQGALPEGAVVEGRLSVPASSVEPFRSHPSDPPPAAPAEPREVFACLDHADSLSLDASRCPIDRKSRMRVSLGDHQRLRWWCPMHPKVAAEASGGRCDACGGMALKPRILSFRPPGQVLAVPESAVIDTGTRTVVFVESMPGMFDGVEVVLGPRCGSDYPVVRGLDAGQRIAITGAFLLDAETRLNPSLAASYFGAARDQGRAPASGSTTTTAKADPIDALPPADRASARRQRLCPVTGKPLGSMGTPMRVAHQGQTVFLCCDGCEARFRRDPARYLAKLAKPATP